MKIALPTLLAFIAISAIILASVTADPLWGLGLAVILLPTVVGLLIASKLAKRFESDATDEQRRSMQDFSPTESNLGDTAGKTRIIGCYLLFIATIFLLIGTAIGLFTLVAYAVFAPQSDAEMQNEFANIILWAFLACCLLLTSGALLAGLGAKQILSPMQIKQIER